MSSYVYLVVPKNDPYGLPILVADSCKEIADYFGKDVRTLFNYLSLKKKNPNLTFAKHYVYKEVIISDEEEELLFKKSNNKEERAKEKKAMAKKSNVCIEDLVWELDDWIDNLESLKEELEEAEANYNRIKDDPDEHYNCCRLMKIQADIICDMEGVEKEIKKLKKKIKKAEKKLVA